MQLTKKKGFTLIEIVIVLAIAALILIIVFLAVTGAQRSRRDEQRRTDLNRVAAQLETFAGNNDGDYPDDDAGLDGVQWGDSNAGNPYAAAFGTNYLNTLGNLNDPSSGTQYAVDVDDGGACTSAGVNTAQTIRYARVDASPRQYTLCIGLEQGIYVRDLQ